jgi:signal transduction histidine kinase
MISSFKSFAAYVSKAAVTEGMPISSARKRIVFNQINLFAFSISLVWFLILSLVVGFRGNENLLLLNGLPLLCSLTAALLMINKKDRYAIRFSFFIYPLVLSSLAVATGHAYILCYIIIFCLLIFFFLNNICSITVIFLYNTVVFAAGVFLLDQKAGSPFLPDLYVVLTALAVIYIVSYIIKGEWKRFESKMKSMNNTMDERNKELSLQKIISGQQAISLEEKTEALGELNDLKTKIFSLASNELIGHIYAANGLIKDLEISDYPNESLKKMLPYLKERSDNSVQVIEHITAWSKKLMKLSLPKPQVVSVRHLITAVTNVCRQPASVKGVDFRVDVEKGLDIIADRDMMELVLRNVVEDAVESAPPLSTIGIKAVKNCTAAVVQVIYFSSNGEPREIEKIFTDNCSEKNTLANEVDEGMSKVLVKELVEKNNGSIRVKDQPGLGKITELKVPLFEITGIPELKTVPGLL